MPRHFAIFACFILSFQWSLAQQPPAIDPSAREAAAKIEAPQISAGIAAPIIPPTVPGASAAPSAPVAPPMPGQLNALPAAPPEKIVPSRIPDMPVPETSRVPTTPLTKNKIISSTSTSGQFIVHGNDLSLRSAFSSRCEEVSQELSQLLRDKHAWVSPIVVLLNSGDAAKKDGKAASMAMSEITHGGFHLQVTINLRPDLRPSDVRAEIIRALLAERILKDQKELKSQRTLLLPDWLYTGIIEALDYRKQARPSTLFAVIFKSGKIFGIEEIIEASPVEMDALSKTIYKTSCCALVLALLDQPEGGIRLNRFLASLAADTRPERDLLNQAFPGFAATPASLNKWWALQLASLSSPGISEPLSITDTLAALSDALTLHYQAKVSEIPKPRPVIAPIVAPPETATPVVKSRLVADSKPAAKSKPSEAEDKSAEEKPAEETEKQRRSFFSRLNPFSSRKSDDEKVIADAIEEAAKEEAKSRADAESALNNEPAEVIAPKETEIESNKESKKDSVEKSAPTASQAQESKPFFQRLFGSDEKPKQTEEKVKDTQPAAKTPVVKDAPVPTEEDAVKPVKKPSILNPLNWFRDSKPKNDDSADVSTPELPASPEPAKTPEAPKTAPTTTLIEDWQNLDSPLIAAVYQEALIEKPVEEKKRFLGLFGGKKKDSNPPKDEPESKPETQPKEKAKPEPKPAKPTETEPAAKRSPMRIRPLFGKSEPKPEEPETPAKEPSNDEPPAKKPTTKLDPESIRSAPEPEKEMPVELPVEKPTPAASTPPTVKPATKAEDKEPTAAAAIPIDDFAAILKRPDRKDILQYNLVALAALQQRCAVLFRPIVADYTTLVTEIRDGKPKDVEARLKKLRARTQAAVNQSKAIRDLLDTHEANGTPAMSGLFDEYLRLPETIRKELPERKDPISIYLDALDREFSKP